MIPQWFEYGPLDRYFFGDFEQSSYFTKLGEVYLGSKRRRKSASRFDHPTPSVSKGIRTKIEATELDRRMLLEKLNTHQDQYMRFEFAESDYNWRIVFSNRQGTTQFRVRVVRHK